MTPTQIESLPRERSDVPVLEVRDLAVHFGGVKAVDGISFTLYDGLIYGIIGPNGSGKSTALGAITRLTKMTSGRVLINGRDFTNAPANSLAREGVARTFQAVRLLPDRTVEQNVLLGAEANTGRRQRREAVERARAAIARMNLSGLEDHYPSDLSYGTQRRVEIARAIAMKPRLLLLDEPTAGMNQAERAEISQLLKELRSEGLCQLLVEHDVQMMIDTCDMLIAMNFGRIIAQGTPTEVVRDQQVREAYLGKKWSENASGA